MSVKYIHFVLGLVANPGTGVFLPMPYKGEDKDGNDVSTNRVMPGIADNHEKLGKRCQVDPSPESPEGTNPAYTLIWSSQDPVLKKKENLLF